MIPAALIPVGIHLLTKLIDYGFSELEKKSEETRKRALDKIKLNQQKREQRAKK